MAYIGQQPVVGRYILLDQISGGFDGSASGFTMSTAGGAQGVKPGLAQNVLLSLGGVIQQPGVDYTISGSGITFTTPPVSGTTFFATVLGDAQSVGTPSDGTVTPASIASGFDFGFPNVNVTGVTTIASGSAAAPSLTITGDTDTGLFSPAANVLAITTSGSAALTVSGSNIGMGTNSPDSLLVLNATAPTLKIKGLQGDPLTNPHGFIDFENTNTQTYVAARIIARGQTDAARNGQLLIQTNSDGISDPTANLSTAVTIDQAQRVGIGNTTPPALLSLDVNSNNTTQASFGGIAVANSDTTTNNGSVIAFPFNATQVNSFARIGVINADRTSSTEDQHLFFGTIGAGTYSERMRIDSIGRVLIGDDTAINVGSPATSTLQVEASNPATFRRQSADTAGPIIAFGKSRGTPTDAVQDNDSIAALRFAGSDGTDMEARCAEIGVRVDGAVASNSIPGELYLSTTAVGGNSPTQHLLIRSDGTFQFNSSAELGTVSSAGTLKLYGGATNHGGQIDLTGGLTDDGIIRFRTGAGSGEQTVRMTINDAGDVFLEENIYVDEIWSRTTTNSSTLILGCRNAVGTESETCRARVDAGLLVGRNTQSFNNEGHMLWTNQGGAGSAGAVYHERDQGSTTVMWLHHIQVSSTGVFINFNRGNASIGTISFSGSTVSYNPFLGSHWAALTDRSKPNLLPGTILETVNQLMEWKLAVFTANGETKKMAWNGTESVGSTVTVTYEGSDYTATIQLEEDAEELNKHVCVKVNDTAGSSAVFGVFLGWDDTNADGTDEANPIIGAWNDMNVAAVGNYFIRIAAGQTVAIGDLIEADGSGCGVVQSDDIIRSKTVAKVTSTTAQETYDDGSFLVTCVLCCG